jgi:hypothetical protein
VAGFQETFQRLTQGGRRSLLVLADTPSAREDFALCLSTAKSPLDCALPRREALLKLRPARSRGLVEPAVAAVLRARKPGLQFVDLSDQFCSPQQCSPVVGNVLVYADPVHVSPDYMETVLPVLRPRILRHLGQGAVQPSK